jgi:WD40 repeat protein
MSFRQLLVWLTLVVSTAGAYGDGPAPFGADKSHTDLYGDPLPEGAVLRLGTSRLRSSARLIQFTPDGRTLITCEQGRIIKHWNAETGEERQAFIMPLPSWSPEALSADGSLYAGGDGEGGLGVWEVATGRRLYQLAGVLGVTAAFSPDGATLATADSSQQLCLWDAQTGKKRPCSAAKYMASELLFSPDGERLAVRSNEWLACLDATTGRELWRTDAPVFQAAWSRDGATVAACMTTAAASKDGKSTSILRFLNAANGKPAGQVYKAASEASAASAIPQYSPDGAVLAWLTIGEIVLWDLKTAKVRRRLPLPSGANNGLLPFAFAPDGKTLTAVVGCTIHRWDLATGKDLYPDVARRGPNGGVKAVAWSPDGKRIATMSYGIDPRPYIWDAATGKLLRVLPAPEEEEWWSLWLTFAPDGKRLFTASTFGKVRCWEVDTGKKVWSGTPLNPKKDEYQSLAQMRLSADGSRLFLLRMLQNGGPGPAELSTWDAATGACKRTTSVPLGCSSDVLSPDGLRRFVRGGATFDAQTGEASYTLRANNDIGGGVGNEFGVVSPDGALIAAPLAAWEARGTSANQRCRGVQVWETATGARVAVLPETDFGTLAFSPDGRTIAVVGSDDIRIWDLITCNEVYRMPVARRLLGYGPVVAFSPDGSRLVGGCSDTTAIVWNLSSARRRAAPAGPLTAKSRDALWDDLAGDDATKAYAAIDRLAARPGDGTALLRERLRPAVGFPQDKFKRLLAALDADDFEVREAAARQLAESEELLEAPLRAALEGDLTAEQRFRIVGILKAAAGPSAETLRGLRGVRALAWAGTPAAREVLEKLADGGPDAALTREARSALTRWK